MTIDTYHVRYFLKSTSFAMSHFSSSSGNEHFEAQLAQDIELEHTSAFGLSTGMILSSALTQYVSSYNASAVAINCDKLLTLCRTWNSFFNPERSCFLKSDLKGHIERGCFSHAGPFCQIELAFKSETQNFFSRSQVTRIFTGLDPKPIYYHCIGLYFSDAW